MGALQLAVSRSRMPKSRRRRESREKRLAQRLLSGEAAVLDLDRIWRRASWKSCSNNYWDLFYPPRCSCSALPPITRPLVNPITSKGVYCQLVSTPLGAVHVWHCIHHQMLRSLAGVTK
ncbi:hypothetical protein V8C35DRAFT_202367 [Trichoderma chlorosporum]